MLLDGAKALYPDILDYSPDHLARVRSPESGYVSVPFGGDVELSMWLG